MRNPFLLSSPELWKSINDEVGLTGGAYRLFLNVRGEVKPIGRLLGTDMNGTLYIGKADSYVIRLINLKKTISKAYRSHAHICGRRYNLNSLIGEMFPFEDLYLELFPSTSPEKLEAHMINEYFDKFGEVPPLNANGGNSKFK